MFAGGGKLHATRPWAILVEREMRSGVMMILKIARQNAATGLEGIISKRRDLQYIVEGTALCGAR